MPRHSKPSQRLSNSRNTLDPALFPSEDMRQLLAQVWGWMSVTSIVSAAHILEHRAAGESDCIYLGIPDADQAQRVFTHALDLAISTFRCSPTKLALASRVDPTIRPNSITILKGSRMRHRVRILQPDTIPQLTPHFSGATSIRVVEIREAPALIELVFEPLQMLRGIISHFFGQASRIQSIRDSAAKTTDEPMPGFVHRHYGDSAFAATLDAMIYHEFGCHVGMWLEPNQTSIEPGFRCVNLIGVPPLNLELFTIARSTFAQMQRQISSPVP